MKKSFAALAAATSLALAACGGGNDDATTADTTADTSADDMAAVVPETAGMYTGTNDEGQPWTANLKSDGTYEFTENGEVTQFGTYDNNIRGTCLTEDTGDAAAPGQEMCYNFEAPAADGTVTVTGPDGTSFTMNKSG